MREGNKVSIGHKEYTLGSMIGEGKEGSIFNIVERPEFVVKIINEKALDSSQRIDVYNHLNWLYNQLGRRKEKQPVREYFVVPLGLLDDQLGYVMRKLDNHELLSSYLRLPEDMNTFDDWYCKKYTLKKRYQIIKNIFDALRRIHIEGLIFTDLSPNNIMVHKEQNQIAFIDTDNTRRRTDSYLGVLGTPGYMAPEIYRKPECSLIKNNNIDPKILSDCGRITVDSDIFSAAVIAFELLTLCHPFIGDEIDDGEAEAEERALRIETDYIFKSGTSNFSTRNLAPYFEEVTTPEIRELFKKTFVDGKNHPSQRPTAEEFYEAFQNGLDLIVECQKSECGFSRIYIPGKENICLGCNNLFEKQTLFVIYSKFQKRSDVINGIGNHPQYDVEEQNLWLGVGTDSRAPDAHFEMRKILLKPGKENFLYARHFECTEQRDQKAVIIKYDKDSGRGQIFANKKIFAEPYLIDKSTRQEKIYINDGKENFSLDKYGVVFGTVKHHNGYIKIFGKFVKE